jgi:hypothetical protein
MGLIKRRRAEATARRFDHAYWTEARRLLGLRALQAEASPAATVLTIHDRAMECGTHKAFGTNWSRLPLHVREGMNVANLEAIAGVAAIPLAALTEASREKADREVEREERRAHIERLKARWA